MTRVFASVLVYFAAVGLFQSAQAQSTAPDFPTTAPAATPAPVAPRLSPAAKAREERRQRMSPEEARRDQQMEILESRAGYGGSSNTTFGRGASQARQYDGKGGGFKVKKFKDKRPGQKGFKRGQSRAAGGIDPKGKPLRHNNRGRNHFGIF